MTAIVSPHDHQAEEAVLGACLLSGTLAGRVAADSGLRPEHFHREQHQLIFAAMVALADRDVAADTVTVAGELGPHLARVGGRAAIDLLAGGTPNVSGWQRHAEIVLVKARWRDRLAVAHARMAAIQLENEDAYQAAEDPGSRTEPRLRAPSVEETASRFFDWLADRSSGSCIPTPWDGLNDCLAGGLRGGSTYVLGSWSGVGKSICVDQVAEHAGRIGASACVLMNEMREEERVARWLTRETGVPFGRILRRKGLTVEDNQRIVTALPRMPFLLQPCPQWSVEDVCRFIRRHRFDLWAVDLATRIPAVPRSGENVTSVWQRVSGMLADLALATNTAGVVVCQLNRERDKNPIKPPPCNRDLLNASAWEQDHRHTMFVHRDQEIDDRTDRPVKKADGALFLEKNSSGRPDEGIQVRFVEARMRFVEVGRDGVALPLASARRLEAVA